MLTNSEVIHKVVVGSKIASHDDVVTFQVGFKYNKRTVQITRIEEGPGFWFFIYVKKLQELDNTEYLWDKIKNDNIQVQYDLSFSELEKSNI